MKCGTGTAWVYTGLDVRRKTFYALDRFRGSPVSRHMALLEKLQHDALAAAEFRAQRLESILQHARDTVPYYRDAPRYLEDYPVLTKQTVQERYDDFFSLLYRRSELFTEATSGSYGIPLRYFMTQEQRAQRTAEIIYYSSWGGYAVGMKNMYLSCRKNPQMLRGLVENQIVLNPRFDPDWDQKAIALLNKGDIKVLIAQPSVLEQLMASVLSGGLSSLHSGLISIITFGEPLPDPMRARISIFFGCKVLGRYAAIEQGVLAQQCDSLYHVNPVSHIVEILDLNEDKPVREGEPGRIVVTNLSARAMPLIRYEMGDLGVWGGDPCRCKLPGPTLSEIIGREVDVVRDTAGVTISPSIINLALIRDSAILQYQFLQHGEREYELIVRATPNFLEEELLAAFRLILGEDAIIEVTKVLSIPPLPSGKRPVIINRMRKST
jgi:phenylacetate-CoA ligase